MTTHATIDLETIDTCPQATVLSLGGVKFNPLDDSEPHSEMYFKISILKINYYFNLFKLN